MMLKRACLRCGFCDFTNTSEKCRVCGGSYSNLSLIQGYKLSKLGQNERISYMEQKIIGHKIDPNYDKMRREHIQSAIEEYQQQKAEREQKERKKISAYQDKYFSFLEEAQNQGIPRSRAEEIASYAMQHNLYQLPHCPACGSVDANKIGTGTKVAKTAAFGVVGAMSDAGKTWKCCKCGSKW